jgi:nucleoside transporter
MTMSTTALEPTARQPVAWVRLSLMMFLQYAVWGVWLPILANYLGKPVEAGGLGFSGAQLGWILGLAGSIGAVSAPFIAGQLADRVMNAERALGALLVLGALVKFVMTYQTSYASWMILSIVYSILYMPTLALTNSVAFAHLTDREKQFPPIRAWGTIGWIVASVAFPLVYMKSGIHFTSSWPFIDGTPRADQVAQMKYAMFVSGVISLGYGIFCFVALPKTPPRRDGEPLAFAAAFRLLTKPSCLALMASALLISMIHQLYFVRTGPYITDAIGQPESEVGPIMAIGQVSEIVFLAILGLFLKHIGYKWIIVLGALSYMARYAIFATIPTPGVLKLSMLLHGMNYGFFFAGAFMFVEKIAPANIRHSAQTVFGIIILGVGPVLAGVYNQWLDTFAVKDAVQVLSDAAAATTAITSATTGPATVFDYATFWMIQSAIALLSAVILMVGFPNRWEEREDPLPAPVPEAAS